ncbi:MAG: bifunctional pyr operon transcriptional regulator/uracil phosphoribosyltransferase PyrR [Clostridiales bacterium]|nr:bifunctional pyr operon transcriptional regulator/uracil phosphoribosyltransferase PyrR [Clostridiales bacterium]
MQVKRVLMDALAIERALKRISHEIIENNKGVKNIVMLGIAKGGIPVCEKLASNILDIENVKIPIGSLDITNFRDDVLQNCADNKPSLESIGFSLQGKDVVLCDDVLYTGRTVRAGIEAVIKLGRPKSIQLAVLIDRGHRELPIRADYVGKNVPTSKEESVSVQMANGDNSVILCQ